MRSGGIVVIVSPMDTSSTQTLTASTLASWLVDRALQGLPPWDSAAQLAARYRDNADYAHDEARVDALVRWESGKAFGSGFVTGLGGLLAMPLTLPSGLGAAWLLQARLAAAVASLRGHDIDAPWVQSLVLLSLSGAAAPDVLRQAGVRLAERLAARGVARLSQQTLQQINARVGFRLLAAAGGHGLIHTGRLVPAAGAAVGGAFDAYACVAVARAARELFVPPRLIGGSTYVDAE